MRATGWAAAAATVTGEVMAAVTAGHTAAAGVMLTAWGQVTGKVAATALAMATVMAMATVKEKDDELWAWVWNR